MCVDKFSDLLSSIVLPHCKVTVSKSDGYNNRPVTKSNKNVDKPWFNNVCKIRYSEYKSAVYQFNMCKSTENHRDLLDKRFAYKKLVCKLKREYERHEGDMREYLRKHNPKQFYKFFSKRKSKSMRSTISLNQFFDHFKNLGTPHNDNLQANFEADLDSIQNSLYEELDVVITESEIAEAIKKLNTNKSCAEDNIINEIFIHCKTLLLPHLCKLFNTVYTSGFFPAPWAKGCIVPVFKKGDCDDPNNYRGITIVSCLGKLFTSILNNRLLHWDKEYNIITDAQFGFKPGLSTIDAIFVLQSLINRTLKKKKKLYCCFVDYQKAFDFIDRSNLWAKLIKQGITGKMFTIIKSLYDNVKSCVKHNGHLTDYFNTTSGLMQGEVMSPILFSLYINDFEMHFIRENCPSVEIQLINIFLLMYADDTVLIAETADGLQKMLDALLTYTKKWNLTVNIDKTKILVFRNGKKLTGHVNWTYDGKNIEVVDQFNYLGMLFNYNGKFTQTQRHVAEQGRKALFAISSTLKNFNFNLETKCAIFDTYVSSILNYGCEIWGFHKAPDVEKLHLSFLKRILGVKKSTCNNLIYCELGRYPLQLIRKLRIFRYMLKLRSSQNCILNACFREMIENNDDWILNVKNELAKLGLNYLWDDVIQNNCFINIVENRMKDMYRQTLLSDISRSSKGFLYQHMVDNFTMQYYLCKPVPAIYKKYISKFRLSSHNLNIEKGRYTNENRRNRICTRCTLNDIEDEFHFILVCPFYSSLRKKYVKKFYYERPSVYKVIKLLSVNNVKELCNLGKYLYLACKKRDSV